MYHRSSMLLGLLAAAVISVACGPTDSSLTAKVKTNLATDETVKTASIDVAVQKKVVTLSGTVDTPAVKEKAVAVTRQTAGVADVVDQITVKEQVVSPGPGPGVGRDMMQKGMAMEGKEHPDKGKHE